MKTNSVRDIGVRSQINIKGLILKSNFIKEQSSFEIALEFDAAKNINEEDVVKVIFFVSEDGVKENSDGSRTFTDLGYRVMRLTETAWSLIFENFSEAS